jgi:hypothetical protein
MFQPLAKMLKKILILGYSVKFFKTLAHILKIYFNLKPKCPKKFQS